MKTNQIKFSKENDEEKSLTLNPEITNNKPTSKKRKKIDETDFGTADFDIKRQRLSPQQTSIGLTLTHGNVNELVKMIDNDSKEDAKNLVESKNPVISEQKSEESYDIVCEYLNTLIPLPHITWRTNREEEFQRYEIDNLTSIQVVMIKQQLSNVLNQAIVNFESPHDILHDTPKNTPKILVLKKRIEPVSHAVIFSSLRRVLCH